MGMEVDWRFRLTGCKVVPGNVTMNDKRFTMNCQRNGVRSLIREARNGGFCDRCEGTGARGCGMRAGFGGGVFQFRFPLILNAFRFNLTLPSVTGSLLHRFRA